MTNAVSTVQMPQSVSIGKNPRVLTEGMKLIDVYKAPHLFELFKAVDIDEDGVISEGEFELYDKKDNLKQEAFEKSKSFNKLTKEHAVWALGFAGVVVAAHFTAGLTLMAAPVAIAGILMFSGFMSVFGKNQKKGQQYVDKAYEQCQKLDEEYRLKLKSKESPNNNITETK